MTSITKIGEKWLFIIQGFAFLFFESKFLCSAHKLMMW